MEWNWEGRHSPPTQNLNNETAAVLPWHNFALKGWQTINGEPYSLQKYGRDQNLAIMDGCTLIGIPQIVYLQSKEGRRAAEFH